METSLLPIRMVNEATYCRRLFWLEQVTKQFVESHDTRDGTRVHDRVDKPGGRLARLEDGEEAPAVARSVTLSSETLGIVAKIDLVESLGKHATPVDYKRAGHCAGGMGSRARPTLPARLAASRGRLHVW